MVGANVVRDFQIGNTRIRIADNYCKKTACEVERLLERIARQAQRQFNVAASTGKYEQEQDTEIPADCCELGGDGDIYGGSSTYDFEQRNRRNAGDYSGQGDSSRSLADAPGGT